MPGQASETPRSGPRIVAAEGPGVPLRVTGAVAAAAAADKLGTHIVAFDVAERLGLTDAFLIASGASERQVNAIVDGVEEALLKEEQLKPLRREGRSDGHWVLLDYGHFVVHVQHREDREFYALDRLWKDCPTIPFVDASLPEGVEPTSAGSATAADDDADGADDLAVAESVTTAQDTDR